MDQLDGESSRFSPSDTETGQSPALTMVFQCCQQGDDDSCTGGPDGMPEGTGPTVDIHFFRIKFQFADGGHGHHGKGFVDFIEIHVSRIPF